MRGFKSPHRPSPRWGEEVKNEVLSFEDVLSCLVRRQKKLKQPNKFAGHLKRDWGHFFEELLTQIK